MPSAKAEGSDARRRLIAHNTARRLVYRASRESARQKPTEIRQKGQIIAGRQLGYAVVVDQPENKVARPLLLPCLLYTSDAADE